VTTAIVGASSRHASPAIDQIRAVVAGNSQHDITDLTDALALMSNARSELDWMELFLITALRAKGLNWADVGEILGVTAQGAQQRAVRLGVPGTTKGGAA
jgi:hypothetical protein